LAPEHEPVEEPSLLPHRNVVAAERLGGASSRGGSCCVHRLFGALPSLRGFRQPRGGIPGRRSRFQQFRSLLVFLLLCLLVLLLLGCTIGLTWAGCRAHGEFRYLLQHAASTR